MRQNKLIEFGFLVLIIPIVVSAQVRDFMKIKTDRLSERAIVFSESAFNTNQLILKSEKGLILIDTGFSPEYAKNLRTMAEREFGINNFVYVVNTHHHWDHIQGNQVFTDATIVGHKNCIDKMRKQRSRNTAPVASNVRVEKKQDGTNLPPPPPSPILIDGVNGYHLSLPTTTFNEQLQIDAGDLSIHLVYYGESHTNNNILIYCPEESVLAVGDLFYKKSLPPFSAFTDLDVPKWLKTLDWVLDEKHPIKYIVSGHNELFSREDLVLYRNYIKKLWSGIKESVSRGHSLEEIQEDFSLKNNFPELVNRDQKGNQGGSLHEGNVRLIWNKIRKNQKENLQ